MPTGISSIPRIHTGDFFTDLMEPPLQSQRVRGLLNKSSLASSNEHSFYCRHFESAKYCIYAWVVSLFDTCIFVTKAFTEFTIDILELDWEHFKTDFKENVPELWHSFFINVALPFCLFAGIFFPKYVFGEFQYDEGSILDFAYQSHREELEQRARNSVRLEVELDIRQEIQQEFENQIRRIDLQMRQLSESIQNPTNPRSVPLQERAARAFHSLWTGFISLVNSPPHGGDWLSQLESQLPSEQPESQNLGEGNDGIEIVIEGGEDEH